MHEEEGWIVELVVLALLVIVAVVIVTLTEVVRICTRLTPVYGRELLGAAVGLALTGLLSIATSSSIPVAVGFVLFCIGLEVLDLLAGPYLVAADDSVLAPWFGKQAA